MGDSWRIRFPPRLAVKFSGAMMDSVNAVGVRELTGTTGGGVTRSATTISTAIVSVSYCVGLATTGCTRTRE